ncbi:polysaccharide biosynthesis/export family protein [Telluribacter humicola]|uniref:polysaccharide biosynthesis/export family protein n=1 Tax=Telluribacter humicola TaxID=1720261 RepID=UPI001A95C6FD|nr:SLBB domain-containing protein [Telluribacter humicola]
MNTKKLIEISKIVLISFLIISTSLSNVFSQVAPAPTTGTGTTGTGNTGTGPTGTGNTGTTGNQPGSTTNNRGPAGTQGNPANPNAPTNNTNQQGEVLQDAKSNVNQERINAELQAESEANQKLTQAEQQKLALRQRIFGYSIFTNKTFQPNPDLNIATPRDYTIGPEDELDIYVYGYAQITYNNIIVNRDGFITLPRAGSIYVSGKTIEEVRKILIDKLSSFIPGLLGSNGQAKSTLTVTLGRVRSINVFVTGEVVNPGSYQLSSLSSAFNALFLAGGPNELGTFRDVRVVRNGKVVSRMDLYDLLMNGTAKGDIRLQDNDNIIVGVYKERIDLTGEVKRPGIFELLPEENLATLLEYAGGFSDNAYTERVRVYRVTPRERRIIEVREPGFGSFDLKSGDEVEVQVVLDRFENLVSIQGSVMRPGEYSIDSNPTLKTLIKNADGLREDAFTGRGSIIRTNDDLSVQNISFNVADIINGTVEDIELKKMDVVAITSKFDLAEPAYVHIQGEVNTPNTGTGEGIYPYMANMTLEDLILKAGGFKESAKASQVEIVRRKRDINILAADAKISETYSFDVSRDLNLRKDGQEFVLQPYDEIIVRRAPNYREQTFVAIEGEILNPGFYGIIAKNEKISDIIQRAGGLTDLAYPDGATLVRQVVISQSEAEQKSETLQNIASDVKKGAIDVQVQQTSEQLIGINLEKILRSPGSNEDLIIQEGDIIRIPKRLETVQVQGELLYPTTVKYARGMRFLDYISHAGGFTRKSLRKSAYVKYPNGSIDRTRKFLAFNIYPKVEPGSEIYVPMRTGTEITAQQALQQGVSITSTLFTLILSVLAFRNIR